MDRHPSTTLLSWLLVPVAFVLVEAAFSLPRQPYTGLALHRDRVMEVEPGSPGERAGLLRGDRIVRLSERSGQRVLPHEPMWGAAPSEPLLFERTRGETRARAWLVPDPLPDGERRMMAAMLAVSSVFVLLGGWVWSERRDALARTFFLMCLSFAWLLAPLRRWTTLAPRLVDQVMFTGIEFYLPALVVHFFALFPESRAQGSRQRWIRAAYAIATVLYVPTIAIVVAQELGYHPPSEASDIAQAVAALWFGLGLAAALGLFAASYRRAASGDARRRLRVVLLGFAAGVGPLAALIAVRNIWPGTVIPGERSAALLTLLVPASFAWAIVVHRIFDFRVAIRAALMVALVAAAGAVAYAAGEWVTSTWWPALGGQFAGGALACVALAASLAGPAAPWLGSLGVRLFPDDDDGRTLADWRSSNSSLPRSRSSRVSLAGRDEGQRVLAEACETVARSLRLDGCAALVFDDRQVTEIASSSTGVLRPGAALATLRPARLPPGIQSIDQAPLDTTERDALERAGVAWLLPVDAEPMRALLLLGRRLAGTWLGRREIKDLERFAAELAVTLENADLRLEARSRGALERELKEAGAIQAHLLPRGAPVYPTLDCAAATLSCEAVGGDYYDFVQGSERDLTLAVGDAAGKGVPAALLLAQVQARFRSQAQRGVGPGQILDALNQDLVGLDQPEKFVGVLCARVEVRDARVWIANGGITPPLIRRADGEFIEILSGGILLGVSAGATYPEALIDLDAGDVLVVHTDGLTEACRGEQMFGTEGARAVLDEAHGRRAADIVQALLGAVRSFAEGPLDDLTVVVLKQLTHPARNGGHPTVPIAVKKFLPRADARR